MNYGNNHPPMLNKESAIAAAIWIGIGTFVLGGGIASCAYVKPKWNVWSAQMQGEAEYAQAEQNRRITVLEAEAKLEAAKSLAAAEIERAKGVAQANEIIGKSQPQLLLPMAGVVAAATLVQAATSFGLTHITSLAAALPSVLGTRR